MADHMILGEGARYTTDCGETGLNNNVIVCGTSGCGKTMSVLEPRLLETHNCSLIVPVAKRKQIDKYAPLFQRRGYRVGVLDFTKPEKSMWGFDPMHYIHSDQDIQSLANFIIKAQKSDNKCESLDPFWDNSAGSLLTAGIYAARAKKNATFDDVLDLLLDRLTISEYDDHINTSLDGLFEQLERRGSHSMGINSWKTFHEMAYRTAASVNASLTAALYYLFTPELRSMIANKPSVNFEDLASEKTILFVYTSAVDPTLNHVVKLFYSHAIKELYEFAESRPDGRLPIPVDILCDDFANGGCIQNFPEYISIFREKGISTTLFIQSESQLNGMYGPDNAATIINNCDTYVYMGGRDVKTCQSISLLADVPLEEITNMPLGKEYIFRRGQKPFYTSRYNVLEDKRYQKVTELYERQNGTARDCGPQAV